MTANYDDDNDGNIFDGLHGRYVVRQSQHDYNRRYDNDSHDTDDGDDGKDGYDGEDGDDNDRLMTCLMVHRERSQPI